MSLIGRRVKSLLVFVVLLGLSFSTFSVFKTQVCGQCCKNQTSKFHSCCHAWGHNKNCTRSSTCQTPLFALPEFLTLLRLNRVPYYFVQVEMAFKIRQEEPLLRPPIV